ncbi:MAG: AMP-binding protein [Exilibacterium sp.]
MKSVKKYGVSIWNSVPALLEMALEYLGEDNSSNLASLRLIMLSGDWIPLPLVQKVKKFCPQAKLVGLGGATEASIWSNYFEIEKLDQNWTSIPYGYPLSNQYFRILDKKLRDVPAWVIGDLYIGGAGLAKSYLNDNKKTDESFIFHPKTGDRLYRTGDIGRYINHDTIEFCGREDSQIKIRGFRVELGEIENTICEIEGIDGAVVTVNGESDNEKTLQAFLKCRSQNACDEAIIRANLVRKLPNYMIPAGITFVDSIPLSANGKVDRKALKTRNTNNKNDAKAVYVKPETHGQNVLSSIWKELLHIKVIGIDDDFFGAGGNSLLAVMLFSRIRETFGNKLPLSSLFSNNTIRSQAKLLEQQNSSEQHSNLETLREGKGETILILFHPVGGDILCYRELVTYLPDDFTIVGVRSLESADPQSSKSSLEEITASYVRQINQRYPGTELSLAGWSMGGVIAYEAAQQLMKNGSPVSAVIMIDSWTGCKDREKVLTKAEMARSFFVDICMNQNAKQLLESTTYGKDFEYFVKLHQIMLDHNYIDSSVECEQLYKLYGIYRENMKTLERYTPSPLDCNIVIFTANRVASEEFTNLQRFNEKIYKYLQNTSSTNSLDGDHFSIMQGENIRSIAKTIRENIISGNRILFTKPKLY